MSLIWRSGIMIVPLLLLSESALAQESESEETVAEQLQSLRKEMEGLRQVNEVMKGEIDELRARTQDNWLTEHRAEEIRSLVQDVLADADTRASLLQDGLIAGWSDHFFLASPDGRFKLQVGGQIQFRWVYNYHDQKDRHIQGFENTRTKLIFQGHVFSPDWSYLVRSNFSRDGGSAVLEDAWIRHTVNNEVSIRVGQFKLPFSREFLVSSTRQLAVERSLIDGVFNVGRSQGIEIRVQDETAWWAIAFSDGGQDNLGAEAGFTIIGIASDPANSPALDRDTEFALTGRYEMLIAGNWEQFNDFTSPQSDAFGMMVGAAIHAQHGEFGVVGARGERWIAWTADISLEYGGANVFASFTHHYVDDPIFFFNGYGVVVQAGVYLTPKWEAFGRYEYSWLDFDTSFGPIERSVLGVFTVGTNYYIDGHDMKWSTDIGFGVTQIEDFWGANSQAGYRTDAEGAEPQIVFRTQLQLLF